MRAKTLCKCVTALSMAFVGLTFVVRADEPSQPKSINGLQLAARSTAPDGKELFHREWLPKDPRAHGGDGLGPVFNDSSCVSCHNLGGSGGAGPANKNVDIVTAFSSTAEPQANDPFGPANATLPGQIVHLFIDSLTQPEQPAPKTEKKADPKDQKQAAIDRQKKDLQKIHPGFTSARSVVLHRFSTNEKYEPWRMQMMGMGHFFPGINGPSANFDSFNVQIHADATVAPESEATPATPKIEVVSDTQSMQKMQQLRTLAQMGHVQGLQGQMGNFTFVHSRRNATALFGAGLIDKIPDSVLLEQAKKTYKDFPQIEGRVAKMKDGKIGRFGWKAQKATLHEFTMTACAVELGLDVPEHPQAGQPLDAAYKPKGHDMDQPECDALVAYLRHLPAPVQIKPSSKVEADYIAAGEKHFAAVGCANCHTDKLGEVAGIYSDLLLHDMGQDLGDSGNYGAFIPNSAEEDEQSEPIPSLVAQQGFGFAGRRGELNKAEREKTIGALRQEWRTPPLWGVRDSGPYLHDGRAETIEQAIAFHGGEAVESAKAYFMLTQDQRLQMAAFLKSLAAPDQSASAE